MVKKPVSFNAHVNSVLYETFQQHPELQKQFRVISTNFDRRGIKFISTYEGILISFKLNLYHNF